MQTMIERVTGLAARVVLREATVIRVENMTEGFRRLDLRVGPVAFAAGQKVQFRVRGLEFRTYTPFAWRQGEVSFLIVRNGSGPAAEWSESLQLGETVQLFGPRKAMDLGRLAAPPVFIGDETSLALTAAWRTEGRTPVAAQLYEVASATETAGVLDRLELGGAELLERNGDAPCAEYARRAVQLVERHPHAPVVLTGNVRSIRAVRDAFTAALLAPVVRAKAHWDPNRKALD